MDAVPHSTGPSSAGPKSAGPERTGPKHAGRTARERARAELTAEIKREARRQLSDQGAQGLSLRAVSRELGMASSALYRYFPSRDDLLTALIIDAYDALGARVEAADRAVADRGAHRARWRAVCGAVREWAAGQPHEYALLYGSPVPGYIAPEATIGPAARVPFALFGVVVDAWTAGALADPGDALLPELEMQAAIITGALNVIELPHGTVVRTGIAWTQLFGMVGFELFGHLAGTLDPADAFFAHTVEAMATLIGLPADPPDAPAPPA
ncbi:TetR/AcrR family transcriptional regulator [Actinomadura parmotrematis]|uniref:TetR/AcrR family transcriptional regulator n=1 Tax=Actinomadura parmotrematis TaxID=2864039 RepID=A0ABS7FU19_9ACTN|nr:TetR/AcrR family transcriptional regulator [Actinomadura parmotrematis]MBW8483087.1 TetR/AcrR family transcriptional regulator [Actinomadura parmotrematis]